MLEVREIRADDAGDFLRLCQELDDETRFMMLEPGERQTSVEEQRSEISRVLERDNSTILVATDEGRIVGYAAAYGGEFRRNRHSASVVAGVLKSHAGRGVGTRLFRSLVGWAGTANVSRLELTVMRDNSAAIALYRKTGFVEEGVRRHSLVVDGAYVDEVAMACILDVRPARTDLYDKTLVSDD